jgi:hypothetical protein
MAERPARPLEPAAPVTSKTRPARKPVFKNGSLIMDDGQRLTVAIRNLSDAGARIEYFSATHLPSEVTLTEPTTKLHRRARVAWQHGNCAGLEFV